MAWLHKNPAIRYDLLAVVYALFTMTSIVLYVVEIAMDWWPGVWMVVRFSLKRMRPHAFTFFPHSFSLRLLYLD